MSRYLYTIITMITLLCSSCAVTRLDLRVDLYKENPMESRLTTSELGSILSTLTATLKQGKCITDQRKQQAENTLEAYTQLARFLANIQRQVYNPELTEPLNFYKEKHLAALDSNYSQLKKMCDAVHQEINTYISLQDTDKKISENDGEKSAVDNKLAQSKLRIFSLLGSIADKLILMTEPLGTDYEQSLLENWSFVVTSIVQLDMGTVLGKDKSSNAYKDNLKNLGAQVDSLKNKLERALLISTCDGLEAFDADVRQMIKGISINNGSLATMSKLEPISGKVKSININFQTNRSLAKLVRMSSLWNSQIDRLQDPSDPVWKIVTDPENKKKWNTQFSKTRFRAEGNSSVVVVRDNPMAYRVQQGTNNPTAAIQSQLDISRALGSVLISVAGSVYGLDAGQVIPTSPNSDEDTEKAAQSLAVVSANTEATAKIREAALKDFERNLELLLAESATINPRNANQVADFRRKLEALLEAKLKFFQNNKTN